MAEASSALLFFLFLFFLTPVICRSPPNTHHRFTSLDVSALLRRAQGIISLTPQQEQADHQEVRSQQDSEYNLNYSKAASLISLQIHSRASLKSRRRSKADHRDYKKLTLGRLARDEARVRWLQARLGMEVADVEREGVESTVTSGVSQGSGEYFTRVGLGRPARPMYMVLDTGSDVTWVQCEPCSECYRQSDPVFDPSSSSSYSPLSCESEACKSLDMVACQNHSCLYQVSYGDGSYTVGEFIMETLTLGDATVNNIALGCGHDNVGLFAGAAGLLGLGGGHLSFPSQLSSSSFSYCLVDRDSASSSTLNFGTDLSNASITSPLLRNPKLPTFYYVHLTGISVGGHMLPIPASSFAIDDSGRGGVIIDSGTAITRLESDVYEALRDAFIERTRNLPLAPGVALFDTCYDLSSWSSVEVPSVAFHFPEGEWLALPAKNYMIPVDSDGKFCLAFATTSAPLSIIGNVQQQGTRVIFNVQQSLVGFSPNNC